MASDTSDDDRPLASSPRLGRALNGHVTLNGSSPLSELSSEDEQPLLTRTSAASPPLRNPSRGKGRNPRPMASLHNEETSDEDVPLASSSPVKAAAVAMPGAVEATIVQAPNGHRKGKRVKREADSDLEEDNPGSDSTVKAHRPRKRVKREESPLSDFEMREPQSEQEAAPTKSRFKAVKKSKKVKKEEVTSDDEPPTSKKPRRSKDSSKARATKKAKKSSDAGPYNTQELPQKGKRRGKEDEEEVEGEDTYKWWEVEPGDVEGDGSEKWQTLEHNGVYFPPPYEPLPSSIKMKYQGRPVDLPPESEEVAGFFAALLALEHAQDAVFQTNFFRDFLNVLKDHPPRNNITVKDFKECDFTPMFEHFEAEKAKKKAMTTAQKKELKAAKDNLEGPYATCLLDGRKEKVGNFRIEPPGLFRGRGEHPRKGTLKLRLAPEDITINIGEDVPIPKPNIPGKWNTVQHDKTVTWLATWRENVNGQTKYVFLAAGSSLKGQSDMNKFEKARELKSHVDKIRSDYMADLTSKVTADRMLATAVYFIDRLALRAGNEKGEEEADTVGCCSLRAEHVTLEPPNFLVFDFLGKDSIRYYNRVEVIPQVFKNIRLFKKNLDDGDALFDRVSTTIVNKKLSSYMKGLTAKVFRTYNASTTFQQQLELLTPPDGTQQEKLNAYNKANRQVAVLCNHQRAVPKTHAQSMGKMKDRLLALKYDRMKSRHALKVQDKKLAKKYEEESDLDEEWIERYEDETYEKEQEKTRKKFERENEKLVADGQEPNDDKVLKKRLKEVEEDYKSLVAERGTGKHEPKRSKAAEKLEEGIFKLDERIKTFKLQMLDKDEGKEVSLTTSKTNYLDPRITTSWAKAYGVPVEKMFAKSLMTKFPWAMHVDKDWKF